MKKFLKISLLMVLLSASLAGHAGIIIPGEFFPSAKLVPLAVFMRHQYVEKGLIAKGMTRKQESQAIKAYNKSHHNHFYGLIGPKTAHQNKVIQQEAS